MNKNSNNKKRKYSLIDTDVYIWQKKMKDTNTGLCVMRYKSDFIIDNLIDKYKLGDEIELNGEKCHITEVGKRCFENECKLFKKNNKPCPLKYGVMFAGEL